MAKRRKLKSAWRTTAPGYVLSSVLRPIWNTFIFVIFILECVRFRLVLDIALHQHNPALTVVKFLGLWLPLYVGIAMQLALFVGLMFGLAQICKSRELDALHSVGFGLHQLMAPVIGLGLIVWLLGLFILGWVQPISLYYSKVFIHEIEQSANVMLAGTDLFLMKNDKTIMLDGISSDGNQFQRVFIYETHPDGKTVTTSGSSGRLLGNGEVKDQHYLVDSLNVMELSDGPSAVLGGIVKDSTTTSSVHVQGPLGDAAKTSYSPRGESEYEWTLGELLAANAGLPFKPESHKLSAELNYRLAQLMFILLLPIIAAVVIIEPRRNPGPIRFLAGILIVLGFYQYLSYGASLSRNESVPPLISLWLPLAALYAAALLEFWKLAYRPAFQPA